jgi:5,10-methylenetetrahydromethanopterin reductase
MIMPDGPVRQVVDAAVHAEAMGCERVWIPDEGLSGRECWVTLGAVAAATERVGIGTGITNAYTRHPGVTASAVATLDELSGGRAALGIGAGGGLTLGPLALERRAPLIAMRELATVSRDLWRGEKVNRSGVGGSFAGASLSYGRPDIPIWFAGRGPKVMALGGVLGDGFILSYVHKNLIGGHVAAVRDAARAAGRTPPRLAYMTMIATDDEAREAARAALTFRLVDSPPEVRERLGLDDARRGALRGAIADGGPPAAAHLVRDEWIDQFVITGTPAECGAELERILHEHAIDEFQVSIPHPADAANVLSTVAQVTAAAR